MKIQQIAKVEKTRLKKIEEEYHGKNIEFVSISTDRQNKHQTWKDMIKNKSKGCLLVQELGQFQSTTSTISTAPTDLDK